MTDERFAFGKNWDRYIQNSFTPERLQISQQHLLSFLGRSGLKGLRMIDIGCGSGLHSLAAHQAGVASLKSFDFDPDSVRTTEFLRAHFAGSPDNWEVEQGSILDEDYVLRLGKFDFVYSWGVLHHTGDQWRAIRNAASMVDSGGLFYIALYSADMHVDPPAEFWLEVKQKYVNSSPSRRAWMVLWYLWRFDLRYNPLYLPLLIKKMLNYKFSRGMNYLTDVRDWIGGWPMEFSWDQDVLDFAAQELGFDLVRIQQGEANTEYLFRKHA